MGQNYKVEILHIIENGNTACKGTAAILLRKTMMLLKKEDCVLRRPCISSASSTSY
jgi:hypothetical protein